MSLYVPVSIQLCFTTWYCIIYICRSTFCTGNNLLIRGLTLGLSIIQKCNPDATLLAHENTIRRIRKGYLLFLFPINLIVHFEFELIRKVFLPIIAFLMRVFWGQPLRV